MATATDTRNNFDNSINKQTIANITNKLPEYEILCTDNFEPTAFTEDTELKVEALRFTLEKDLKGADLKWSLFVAACNTYRYDTCLRPFPPMYIKNENKDIDALRKAVDLVPPLPIMLQELKEISTHQQRETALELLYWVLVKLRDSNIKSVKRECYGSVLKRANSKMPVAAPNLIFQVASSKQSMSEDRWKEQVAGHTTFYAFHGSRLENFHSIINYGLHQHMNKESLFGKGTYLSTELSVSLPYSPVGYGWGASSLGSDMSCVALCEVINHRDVKVGDTDDKDRNIAPESIGGKVPLKYIVVLNNELVRIRYLLVYSKEYGYSSIPNNGIVGWLKQHKLLSLMLGYVFLLASVGLSHNKNVEKYLKTIIHKMGLTDY